MNITIWSKTLLSVYPKLPKILLAVDKSIDMLVKKSMFSSNNAYNDIENIRALLVQKKELQLLGEVVENVLNKLNNYDVLRDRYFRHKTFIELAQRYDTYGRDIFRKHDYQLKKLTQELLKQGYDETECELLWGDNHIINHARGNVMQLCSSSDESKKKYYLLYRLPDDDGDNDSGRIHNPYLEAFLS